MTGGEGVGEKTLWCNLNIALYIEKDLKVSSSNLRNFCEFFKLDKLSKNFSEFFY